MYVHVANLNFMYQASVYLQSVLLLRPRRLLLQTLWFNLVSLHAKLLVP
jgi:hypothetical protein